MCGRTAYKLTWEEIVALYRLTLGTAPHNFQPRFKVCPTAKIDAVIEQDGKPSLADPPVAAIRRIEIFRDAAFGQAYKFGERRMRAAGSA